MKDIDCRNSADCSVNLLDRVTLILQRGQHEEHFRGWGLGLIILGLVILLSHAAIFLMERTDYDSWTVYWLPRGVMFATIWIVLKCFRPRSVLPVNAVERLVWVVWVGYVFALASANAVRRALGHGHEESYATYAVLAGLGFLAMGAHVWQGGYLVGLVFLAAAPLLASNTGAAPLGLGVLWAGALVAFGLHYWKRGASARSEPLDMDS